MNNILLDIAEAVKVPVVCAPKAGSAFKRYGNLRAMKRVFVTAVSGLFAAMALGALPFPAAAEPLQQYSYWDLVKAQDPYFNKSGSIVPQRYTANAPAPAPKPTPGKRSYNQENPLPFVPYTTAQHRAAPAQPMASDTSSDRLISEVRLGVLSHDVTFPNRHEFQTPNPFSNRYESGVNINPEVVFTSPNWLDWFWEPRPHVGISVNTSGDTSSLYSGLGWDTAWDNGLFLDGFLGLAVHDGELRDGNPKGKIEFGSRALFRLGGELGWRWDDHNGIGLLWEHMSNAGVLSDKNQGIDSLGLRYSYRFDTPN